MKYAAEYELSNAPARSLVKEFEVMWDLSRPKDEADETAKKHAEYYVLQHENDNPGQRCIFSSLRRLEKGKDAVVVYPEK
jgi:hypothetical protein